LRWGEDNPCNARYAPLINSLPPPKTYALSSISISPNGWTDQELGALWLEKDFAPASAERLDDPGDCRLLRWPQ
jgi:hypothetical protein